MQQYFFEVLFPSELETIHTLHSHAPSMRQRQSQIAKRGRTHGGLIGRQFEILKWTHWTVPGIGGTDL